MPIEHGLESETWVELFLKIVEKILDDTSANSVECYFKLVPRIDEASDLLKNEEFRLGAQGSANGNREHPEATFFVKYLKLKLSRDVSHLSRCVRINYSVSCDDKLKET